MDSATLFFPFISFLIGAFSSFFVDAVNVNIKKKKQIKFILYYLTPLVPSFIFFINFYCLDRDTKLNDLRFLFFIIFALLIYYLIPFFYKKFEKPEPGFSAEELKELVIDFTKNCKKETIILIGGDFDFLGETPEEMDDNSQFKDLAEKKSKIHIVCEKPEENEDNKIRYGKIIKDFKNVEVSMYNEPELDPQIRGRMYINKTGRNGILFFYRNVNTKRYIQIELENDEHLRQHYLNIWKTMSQNISLAAKAQRDEWVQCYEEHKKNKNGRSSS